MMQSTADTVSDYFAALPADRRQAIEALCAVILENLPPGYDEAMQYGMIGYSVPLSRYPSTYNGEALNYVALASQKNHMAVYPTGCYGDKKLARWFEAEHAKSGKRPDMGKSCIRFRKLEDLSLDLIGRAVAKMTVEEFIALYEAWREGRKRK